MKPIIGITTYDDENEDIHRVNNDYIYSIIDGGGIPITIPTIKNLYDIKKYLEIIDGLVFTGGGDISPLTYGENPINRIFSLSNKRDLYEFQLFKEAYELKKPILAICRGMQLANVCLGGNLYQDIFSQVKNVKGHAPRESFANQIYHNINIENNTILKTIFNKSIIGVNSVHHQAIKNLGRNLKISAKSEDGIIEAIESTEDWFFLGLQFHPESLYKEHTEFLEVFKTFIAKCHN